MILLKHRGITDSRRGFTGPSAPTDCPFFFEVFGRKVFLA